MRTAVATGRSEGNTGPVFKGPSNETAWTKTRDWHDIVTLDKSWFYYIVCHKFILIPHGGKVPDLERVKGQSKK
jgi:hypothetical protein